MRISKILKFEKYESPEDDESYYHEDDYLFGRPNYPKKKGKYDDEDDDFDDEDEYEAESDDTASSDMEHLLYLLRSYFNNQGVEVWVENKGLDITLYTVQNKRDNLKNIINVFNIVKKVKRDILPQYDSEFELWQSKDGRPMLYFNFYYEEGLNDDNPF